jgi:UDP-2,4-diacetamido-2,4,6-trideoxy-beta-L-altropyranose hydrolase
LSAVVIRVDASLQIGSGHTMRCLTLADDLRINHNKEVYFICNELPGDLNQYIKDRGYKLFTINKNELHSKSNALYLKDLSKSKTLEEIIKITTKYWAEDAAASLTVMKHVAKTSCRLLDWVIVDHYGLDIKWENVLRPFTNKIMVIDDLANRAHNCDLLLDQNLYENMDKRYNNLVSNECIKLLGPQYAILRPEFKEARKKMPKRDGQVKRVLIFLGSSDITNQTASALRAIQQLERPDIVADVVVGASNPNKEEVMQLCKTLPNTNYLCQVDNMAELMLKADLALGAGGSTTWERCYMGLPTIVVAVAKNQEMIRKLLHAINAEIYLGLHTQINQGDYFSAVAAALNNKDFLSIVSNSAKNLMASHVQISEYLK